MIIECCSQERFHSSFYEFIGESFCKLNRVWTDTVEAAFNTYCLFVFSRGGGGGQLKLRLPVPGGSRGAMPEFPIRGVWMVVLKYPYWAAP